MRPLLKPLVIDGKLKIELYKRTIDQLEEVAGLGRLLIELRQPEDEDLAMAVGAVLDKFPPVKLKTPEGKDDGELET